MVPKRHIYTCRATYCLKGPAKTEASSWATTTERRTVDCSVRRAHSLVGAHFVSYQPVALTSCTFYELSRNGGVDEEERDEKSEHAARGCHLARRQKETAVRGCRGIHRDVTLEDNDEKDEDGYCRFLRC